MTMHDVVDELTTTHGSRDPFELCEKLDIIVVVVPLVKVNGFYHRYQNQDIIYINKDLSVEEKFLICAHELGHAVLHSDVNIIFLETDKTVADQYEMEANDFAIQLLQINKLPLADLFSGSLCLDRSASFS